MPKLWKGSKEEYNPGSSIEGPAFYRIHSTIDAAIFIMARKCGAVKHISRYRVPSYEYEDSCLWKYMSSASQAGRQDNKPVDPAKAKQDAKVSYRQRHLADSSSSKLQTAPPGRFILI